MKNITTIGLDIAKNSFTVHCEDAGGRVVTKKDLKRKDVAAFFSELPEPCLVGLEACGSAHHWAREIGKLGHDVRLIPAQRVKAFLPRQKNDAADAKAICEAVRRPDMRFVPVKSIEDQSVLMLHQVRTGLTGQRTQIMNMMRGHFAEIGIVVAQGPARVGELVALVMAASQTSAPLAAAKGKEVKKGAVKKEDEAAPAVHLPPAMVVAMQRLVAMLETLNQEIAALDRAIAAAFKRNEVAKRLATIPGVGVFIANYVAVLYPDARAFSGAREFAASLGLAPKQHSTAGKARLGKISKMGNRGLRSLLYAGSVAVLWRLRDEKNTSALAQWARKLLATKPFRVVAVALANKTARTIWAVMAGGGDYVPGHKPACAVKAA